MVVTTGNARSTPRLRRSGLVATGIFACVSVLVSCGSGDGREPTDVGDDVSTTSADDTVPVEGVAVTGEVGVEDQSDPDQPSADEAADTDERVAGPEGSDSPGDGVETDVVETVVDEPDDPAADDPADVVDVDKHDDAEGAEDSEADGDTITVSPADDDDIPSDDGQDSDSQDGSSNETADADKISDEAASDDAPPDSEEEATVDEAPSDDEVSTESETASDSPDETPALIVEDRAQVLELAVHRLNGELFDVSSIRGRDVLLWFWSPL